MVAKECKVTTKVASHQNSKKLHLHASHLPYRSIPLKQKLSWKPAPSKAMKYLETNILNGNIQDKENLQLEKQGCPLGRVNFTDEDKQEMLQIV